MAGSNIPGLNENVMRGVMKAKMRPSQNQRPEAGMAEDEYKRYRKTASPAMQKMMWPSIAATTLTDPMYASPILKGMGMNIPEEVMRSSLGMVGAAGYLGPKVLSEGLKSRRLGYEKQFAPQLGAVGKASRALDSLSTIRYLMTLPGYTQQLLGGGQGILKHTPRPEHFLTGTAGNVIKGKGSTAVEGGGFLTHGYEALKGAGDFVTGGHVSGALASGAKKGGLAGMASSGVGMLDKGISGLLSSPMGVALGITGAQVGLAIYKSIKLARLTPTRQSPDTLGRKYFGRDAASPAMQKILTLASTGKIDPQTLSFMVLQVIEGDIRKTNMMLAGVRGELAAESDFNQQKQDKGEKGFTSNYGKDILGDDDRGVILRGLDALERTLSTVKTKFDPFTQLTNFAFGLLRGKMILPKHEASKIAQIYGYDDEQKMMKEKAESFGVAMDQTRLIHTPSKAIAEMASTFETKQMALASATLDVNRFMLAELMTIRISGFGIEQNILYRKEPGLFKQFMSDMFDKLNPLNLPGINAIYNVAKGLGKFAFKTLPGIPNQMFEMGKKALTGGRDKLFGEEYAKIKDKDEWLKEAGLFSPVAERAQVYIADGLPEQVERIRSVLYNTYYIQEDMLDVFGGQQKRIDQLGVWSSTEKRYLTAESAKKMEESQKIALEAASEKAFRSGPLGKLMYFVDILNTKVGAGFGKRLEQKETVARSIRRLGAAEDVTGKIERAVSGGQETFVSKRALNEVLAGLSSIKTREATMPISMAEIESERRLERVPTSAKWMSGATAVGAAMGVLPILLGFTTGGLGALGVGAVYAELRRRREKEILTAREAEIQTVSETERQIKTMEDYFQIPQEARMAERGVGGVIPTGAHATKIPKKKKLLPLDRLQISGPTNEFKVADNYASAAKFTIMDKIDTTNERLTLIASYLGKSEKDSIFTLLDPTQPRIAEVTMVDKVGKAMTMHAKGGPVGKDKPIMVGEKGVEVFMPSSPGVIIPNDKIDKFADGGMTGGDKFSIFNQIYQKLQDIFVVNQEALAIDVYQEKKAEKDAQQQTMQEKLAGLKVRQDAKTESIWKKDVVDLLSGILKKPLTFTKEKVKEKGFSLWDFLKGLDWGEILKKLLLGLGISGLGASIFTLIDNIKPILTKLDELSDWLKQNSMDVTDQLKVLGRGMLGAGLVAGGLRAVSPVANLVAKGMKSKPILPVMDIAAESGAAKMSKLAEEAKFIKPREIGSLSMENEALNTRATKARIKMNIAARGEESANTMFVTKAGKVTETLGKESLISKAGTVARAGLGKVADYAASALPSAKTMIGADTTVTEGIVAIKAAAGSILSPITKVVKFVGSAFEPLIIPLKAFGRILGKIALPLQMVLTAFDFAGDAIAGYKEGGIWNAVQGFFVGKMKTDMETTLGQIGKYFGVGMMLGMPFGGPIGMLAGGFIGASIGALIGAVKSAFSSYNEGGFSEAISQFFMGDKKGGLLSAIKTMGPYALAGGIAGSVFPVVGTIAGALAGAALGGLVGWMGQWGIGNFVQDLTNAMSEWGPNPQIIKMFNQQGMTYAPMFAKGASIVPIIGPLVGGVIGAALDGIIGVFNFASWSLDKITEFSTWANDGIISMFSGMQYGSQFAQYGAFTVPIVGPLIGGILGSVVDAGVLLFSGISSIASWLSGAKTWIDSSLTSLWPGENAKAGAKMFSGLIPVPGVGPIIGGILGAVVDALMYFAGPIMNIGANITKYLKDKMGAAYDFIFGGDGQAKKDLISKNDAERAARDIKQGKGTPVLTLEQAKAAGKVSKESVMVGGTPPISIEQQEHAKYLEKWNATESQADKKKLTVEYNAAKQQRASITSTAKTSPQSQVGKVVTQKQTGSFGEAQASIIPSGGGNVTVAQALKEASDSTGVSMDVLSRIAKAESNLGSNMGNSQSSAKGLFQFINSTWKDMVTGSAGKKYGFDAKTDVMDLRANALMGAEYIKQNEKLAKQGPGKGSIADSYALHVLGPKGGPQFFKEITKDRNQPAADLFVSAADSNPTIFYKDKAQTQSRTLSETYRILSNKVGQPVTDEQLAKAGTGSGVMGKAREFLGSAKETVGGLVDKASEKMPPKAKEFLGILGEGFGKIKDAFSEAFNRQFNDVGLMKNGIPTPPKKQDIIAASGPQAAAALNVVEKKQNNVVAAVSPSVSSIPDAEKEKQIKDLLTKGQPIMDPVLRKYAKEKGLLTSSPEFAGDKIGSLWNSAQKFGTSVASAGKEALMGQDLNPVTAKSDIEIMKVDQKQGDIAQVAAASKEDSTSIFDTKTIKAKADAMLKSVQEKGASLFGKGAVKGMTGSMPPTPQIQVQRGSFGTEITSSFSILEKDIFGSLDGALINGTANYPFASKMQHV